MDTDAKLDDEGVTYFNGNNGTLASQDVMDVLLDLSDTHRRMFDPEYQPA